MSGSKNALGNYKYIGMITDGSPIYSYEFNDEGSHHVTYIFREFRDNEDKKIWTGRVILFFSLLIFLSVMPCGRCHVYQSFKHFVFKRNTSGTNKTSTQYNNIFEFYKNE